MDLKKTVERLCEPVHYHDSDSPLDVTMPSLPVLSHTVEQIKSVLFPGFFLQSDIRKDSIQYYIGATLDSLRGELTEQIFRGYCFHSEKKISGDCRKKAEKSATVLITKLPELRASLLKDAQAAYEGDPAARSIGEAIFSYPSMAALIHHRIAHILYHENVPLIPRIISEMAHSSTGIDIHPGATIGEYFFIDHGTGTVIGETSIIGKNVRIYQGVTLGAKSFPLDENGKPVKGISRHPIVEDDVIIYSGATILGRVTIGKGAEIGGNVWITDSVAPHTKVTQR